MQNTSQTHRELIAHGAMNVRATIGGTVYGMDKIMACSIEQAILSGSAPEIGACVSNMLSVTLLNPDTIPRMAEIAIEVQLQDSTADGEWVPMGTYSVDVRRVNHDGTVQLDAYDDMLKAEQPFADLFQGDQVWPIKMSAALDLISEAIGVPLDERNALTDYNVSGPEDYTCREVLGFIGAANAGNWTISPQRTLRLVPFRPSADPVQDVGLAVSALSVGDLIEIGRVDLYVTDDSAYIVGDESGVTYSLSGKCPWATQDMADAVLAAVQGYAYTAFSATGAILDPAAELGDAIKINGTIVPLCAATWQLGRGWTAAVSAPGEKEVDHEYPYKTPSARQYERAIHKINATADEITDAYSASIKASEDALKSEFVQRTEYANAKSEQDALIQELTTELEQTASGLSVVATKVTNDEGYLGELQLKLAFTAEGMTLNRADNGVYVYIDNDEVTIKRIEEDGTHTPVASFMVGGLNVEEVAATIIKAASASFSESVSVGRFQIIDEGSLGFSFVVKEG